MFALEAERVIAQISGSVPLQLERSFMTFGKQLLDYAKSGSEGEQIGF